MDFSRLNTKTAAEQGAELHLLHPAFRHPLYDGPGTDKDGRQINPEEPASPVLVTVRGIESRSVQDRLKQFQRDRTKNPEMTDESAVEFVCSLVIGFSGLYRNGEPAEPTPENKRAFFMLSDDLIEQVLAFARERSNFFKHSSDG